MILVSNQQLTLKADSEVEQSGTLSSPAENLLLGSSGSAGAGDGVLVRVGSDASAQISRSNVNGSNIPALVIDPGAKVSGTSLIMDSTSTTSLDPTAQLNGTQVSVSSGQISLVLDNSQPTTGLVLSGAALSNLQASASALALLSYSSIDLYENGVGTIGSAPNASGQYQVQSLALQADEIRGFGGGTVTINAQNVILGNSAAARLRRRVQRRPRNPGRQRRGDSTRRRFGCQRDDHQRLRRREFKCHRRVARRGD